MKLILKIIAGITSAAIMTGACLDCAAKSEETELSSKLIRLHVVANSDSAEDQRLKLEVRDMILGMTEPYLSESDNRDGACKIITEHLGDITAAADELIRERGYDYRTAATLCIENLPTTEYENFSLPAGDYMSLRVTIGEGNGHNWWCVVFPPVCTRGIEYAENYPGAMLTDDNVALITEADSGCVVRFRTIELFNKFKSLFK